MANAVKDTTYKSIRLRATSITTCSGIAEGPPDARASGNLVNCYTDVRPLSFENPWNYRLIPLQGRSRSL